MQRYDTSIKNNNINKSRTFILYLVRELSILQFMFLFIPFLKRIPLFLRCLIITIVSFHCHTVLAENTANISCVSSSKNDTIVLHIDSVNVGIRTYVIRQKAAVTGTDTTITGMQIEKVNYWSVKNSAVFNISQTGYSRWADGGENSMTLSAYDDFYANYIRKNFMFSSYAKSALAYLVMHGQSPQKAEDRIDMKASVGYDIYRGRRLWYGATYFTLTSQFANGYNSNKELVSSFFSPANTTLSFGVIYQPSKHWSIFFAPISGSSVFVLNQDLADKGVGGVTSAEYKEIPNPDGTTTKIKIQDGDRKKLGLGFFTEIIWRQPLFANIDIDTKLRLSNNYVDKRKNNRWNFDVDYQIALNCAITKFFSVNMRMQFLYDDDIEITYKKKVDGEEVMHTGPTLQFKEIIGLGLTWKFSN